MPALFPPLAPYDTSFLDRPDGNRIFYTLSGNPSGRPVLLLHGGPGSGISESARRHFDPARWLIIQFDQRGCGASTPHASDFETTLFDNTTDHLIDDMQALRERLGLRRVTLFGTSWGATLALAYATRFPHRVSGVVLAGVTTTRWSEIDWLYRGLGLFLPEAFKLFLAAIPAELSQHHPVVAYHRLLNDEDVAVRDKAALDWHLWEAGSVSADPDAGFPPRWRDRRYILARARICAHYFVHGAWLGDHELINAAGRLAGIPGALIQGRLDLQGPPETAHLLHQAWPGSRLTMVEGAGHSSGDQGMAAAIMEAIAGMAKG
jgi:proline iminopeptidase